MTPGAGCRPAPRLVPVGRSNLHRLRYKENAACGHRQISVHPTPSGA
ncbi:hypothetical protein PCLA_05r0283 [Pseudomonas citronellolis]|nr:hypothetical protein PCLA_05r0283 [Pseudomonas citronellolis]